MTTLPEEVKNAVAKALRESRWLVPAPAVELILTAARPFLSGQGAVNVDAIVQPLEDIHAPGGLCRWTDVATAIGEVRRALSALEPSAARELALEEAAQVAEMFPECDLLNVNGNEVSPAVNDAFKRGAFAQGKAIAAAIRTLSSPDHADAGKVEGDGWRPIESAPTNRAIQIFIPNADYYGNDGVYAGILVDLGTGQRWATFGWAVARDLPPHMHPSHWRPLPSAPSEGAE